MMIRYIWFKNNLGAKPLCPMMGGRECVMQDCVAFFEHEDGRWRCLMVPGVTPEEAEVHADCTGEGEIDRWDFNDPVHAAYEFMCADAWDGLLHLQNDEGNVLRVIEGARMKFPGKLAKRMFDFIQHYGFDAMLHDRSMVERIEAGGGTPDDVLELELLMVASYQKSREASNSRRM